jgi:predicted pyridoxine 5'-phosphate oxidase superfamily flavin-nucleotide-binding protein
MTCNTHFPVIMNSLFHPGERAAQALAGVAPPNAAIRGWMPDQHRAFFGLLAFLPIATVDPRGAPVATILTGAPGFVTSPDPNILQIAAHPDSRDPAARLLAPGAPVGILGMDLATRRRNRANGRLQAVAPEGLTVAVEQSFGNCPQYIQTRFWQDNNAEPGPVELLTGLDSAARVAVAAADTFFVATSSGTRAGEASGVDISHRGGRPGFIAVDGDTLTIPDFHGNGYFNTFGNLLLDPRTGLLFVDWSTGSLLHLTGRASIIWDDTQAFPGAERLWRVSVTSGWRRPAALPLRWSFGDFAPQIARTGVWDATGEPNRTNRKASVLDRSMPQELPA